MGEGEVVVGGGGDGEGEVVVGGKLCAGGADGVDHIRLHHHFILFTTNQRSIRAEDKNGRVHPLPAACHLRCDAQGVGQIGLLFRDAQRHNRAIEEDRDHGVNRHILRIRGRRDLAHGQVANRVEIQR